METQQQNIINQQDPSAPVKKSGIKFGLSIAIVIILVVATGVAIYWIQTEPIEQSLINIIYKKPADPTASWQTYRNDQYGIEFEYPENWKLTIKTAILPIIKLEPIDKKINVGIAFVVGSPELDFAGISRTERPESPEEFKRVKTVIENCTNNKIIADNKFCIEDFVCFEGDKMTRYCTINQNKNLYVCSEFSHSSGNFLECLSENEIKAEADIFNQILSTLKFTK